MYAINFRPAQIEQVCHQVHNAWTQMAERRKIEPSVRPVIAQSWERCMEYGVPLNPCIPVNRFGPAFDQNAKLLEIARPIITQFYPYIEGSGFPITLTNAAGIVLEVIGDAASVENGYRQNVMPGADFSEQGAGTNAMGTCLINQSPVQIIGAEHYCIGGHTCISAGAPILDPITQKVLGSISVSGKINLAHAHNLGIVVAIAQLIEQQLKQSQLQLLKNIIFENDADGIIIALENGSITSINTRALEILKLPISKPKSWTTISTVPELDTIFQESIRQKSVIRKVTEFGGARNQIELTITPVSYGQLATGAVLVLKHVHKLAPADLTDQDINNSRKTKQLKALKTIKTTSSRMDKVLNIAQIAATNRANVLILGESGTGKELFAKAIHDLSPWGDGPFIPVNCGCIPRDLIASELFGYTEGSFTGALKKGKKGKFECADGGTLFLDEIGEMAPDMQVALLRVLEERYFYPIGTEKGYPINCRVIAATNQDLKTNISNGRFRADLYYRLNLLSLQIPPLRERVEDILFLTESFLHQFARRIIDLEPEIRDLFNIYPWPGNVRELKNTVERLVYLSNGGRITKDMLPHEILAFDESRTYYSQTPQPVSEIDLIAQALQATNNNYTEAAKKMGISRATLYRKLKKLEISKIVPN